MAMIVDAPQNYNIAYAQYGSAPQPTATNTPSFGFYDFLDILNPLQHIPVINTAYQAISGDSVKPASRLMGSMIFGGVIGGVAALTDIVVEYETGTSIAGNAYAALSRQQPPQPQISIARIPQSEYQSAAPSYDDNQAYQDLHPSLLGFTNIGHAQHGDNTDSPQGRTRYAHENNARYND